MTSSNMTGAPADTAFNPTIVVIGLGYVGLPLAVALSRRFPTWGVDINQQRVSELQGGHDRTREIDGEAGATARRVRRDGE